MLSTAVGAELVGMTPRSGGAYSLIRRAYGPYAGFVIGWVDWLSFAADLALKAVVIMEFVAILIPESAAWTTRLAIIVTTVFAAIQLRGISLGALIQETCDVVDRAGRYRTVAGAVFCGRSGRPVRTNSDARE